jgi:NAD(P)-dependent dehydrogenase (short-subunit alcohol dehydrogenase family)
MAGRIAGKTALVTGAASGIGLGCATRLAEEGARVMLTDIQVPEGEAAASALRDAGHDVQFLQHDVTDEAQWESVIAATNDAFGGLNILVNNAGIAIAASIVEMSLSDWQRQQAINLDGVFLGLKHSIPLINTSGGGSIINISSVAGLKGSPTLAAYCATKGGVRLLTKGVARECAAQGWNIRVNSVHPGIIDTPIWTKVNNPELLREGANTLDPNELAAQGSPTGLAGKPVDIANGVLFLASDESSYMSGTELIIDAGLSC